MQSVANVTASFQHVSALQCGLWSITFDINSISFFFFKDVERELKATAQTFRLEMKRWWFDIMTIQIQSLQEFMIYICFSFLRKCCSPFSSIRKTPQNETYHYPHVSNSRPVGQMWPSKSYCVAHRSLTTIWLPYDKVPAGEVLHLKNVVTQSSIQYYELTPWT